MRFSRKPPLPAISPAIIRSLSKVSILMRKATRVSLALGTSAALLTLAAFPASAEEKASDATIEVQAGPLGIAVTPVLDPLELTPGTDAEFDIPTVSVTDNRAGTDNWTTQVSLTDFTNTDVLDAKPITVAGATYTVTPDSLDHDGTITSLTSTDAVWTSAADELAAVTAAGVEGNNTASWDASLIVKVPASALAGEYTATLTHSVL